jgi:hypothetical protein
MNMKHPNTFLSYSVALKYPPRSASGAHIEQMPYVANQACRIGNLG